MAYKIFKMNKLILEQTDKLIQDKSKWKQLSEELLDKHVICFGNTREKLQELLYSIILSNHNALYANIQYEKRKLENKE